MEAPKLIKEVYLPNEEGVPDPPREALPSSVSIPEQKLARGVLADTLWQRVTTQMLAEVEAKEKAPHPAKIRNYL